MRFLDFEFWNCLMKDKMHTVRKQFTGNAISASVASAFGGVLIAVALSDK